MHTAYILVTRFITSHRCSAQNESKHSPCLVFWAIRKGNAKRTNVHFIIQNLKVDDHLMSSEQGDRIRGDVNENEREDG